MKADLHTHTLYSDGKLAVKEIIEIALAKKLTLLAITDHDSIDGIKEALALTKDNNLTVIPGIELSTYKNSEPVHVLGYFPNGVPTELENYLLMQKINRQERLKQYLKNLHNAYGLAIEYDEVALGASIITRSHLAHSIAKKYPELTIQAIFDTYLSDKDPCYVPSAKTKTEEGIALIKNAGGLAVLAHPVLCKVNDPIELIKLGFDGIEALYAINTLEDNQKYLKLAKEYDLLVTAGSDFHYFDDPKHGEIGCVDYPDIYYNEFVRRCYNVENTNK